MDYLNEVEAFNKKFKKIDKLLVLLRFFKTKKIMLTILEEENKAARFLLVSILKYLHAKSEIEASKTPSENMKILKDKISKDWDFEKEFENLVECFELTKKHEKSTVEFLKKGKIYILDEENKLDEVSFVKLKNFILSIKKVKEIFESRINKG